MKVSHSYIDWIYPSINRSLLKNDRSIEYNIISMNYKNKLSHILFDEYPYHCSNDFARRRMEYSCEYLLWIIRNNLDWSSIFTLISVWLMSKVFPSIDNHVPCVHSGRVTFNSCCVSKHNKSPSSYPTWLKSIYEEEDARSMSIPVLINLDKFHLRRDTLLSVKISVHCFSVWYTTKWISK